MNSGLLRVFCLAVVIGWGLGLSSIARADASASKVYVARRGWHIDVGYAKQDLREPLRSLASHFPDAKFIFFGFGDRHYLEDVRNQHGPALLAALWPGRAIILVTTIQAEPGEAFGNTQVIALPADEQQLKGSQDYVWQSLQSQGDSVAVYRAGPYPGSYYFLATATYSAFHTCNTWAAQVLHAGGYPIRVQGVLFAGQLWSRARKAQRNQSTLR